MTHRAVTRAAVMVISLMLVSAPLLFAADGGIGTWVRQVRPGGAATGSEMTMTVEPWGADGRKLTYRVKGQGGADMVLTVESPMDGTDAPVLVNGKPSGETMGIKRVDSHHTLTVLKMNGKQFGISRAALSADGRTLTVENEITAAEGGRQPGKATDTWVRK
jgi:hypothetical protein